LSFWPFLCDEVAWKWPFFASYAQRKDISMNTMNTRLQVPNGVSMVSIDKDIRSQSFVLEYPAYAVDPVSVYSAEEYFSGEPGTNVNFEMICVPSPEFPTVEALHDFVWAENQKRYLGCAMP
jgi:hypothetical protein